MEIEEVDTIKNCRGESSAISLSSASTQVSLVPQKRKYIKKSMVSFNNRSIKALSNINNEKSQIIQITPLYESIQEKLGFILIGGDYIYNLCTYEGEKQEYLKSLRTSDEQLRIYKDIVSITKEDKFLDIKMSNKMDSLIDFRFLISNINKILVQISGENHLELLIKFQKAMEQQYHTLNNIISLYPNYEELLCLQQKRLQYIKQVIVGTAKKQYCDDDFLIVGLAMANFEKKVTVIQNIAFNQAMVSLIGTDFDSLQSYFLRKGIKEFIDFQTRVLIQTHQMRGLINHSNEKFQQPFTLITYDDIKIFCKIEVETIFTNMPDHLKYCQDENPFEILEGGFLIRLILDPNQIQEVLNLRHQILLEDQSQVQDIQSQKLLKEEDICYNMQSQYLIEKFYQNDLKNKIKDASFASTMQKGENPPSLLLQETDSQDVSRCKYRKI